MSDDRFGELMYSALDPIVEETPGLPEWNTLQLEMPGAIPAPHTRWWVAVVAAAIVLVVGVGTLLLGRVGLPGSEVTSGAPSDVAALARGEQGPTPQFDTAALGDEMVLEMPDFEALAASGSLPEVLGPESERILSDILPGYRVVGAPVYLGHIGDVHGLVIRLDTGDGTERSCLLVTEGVSGLWGGCFGPPGPSALASGLRVSTAIPEALSGELPVLTLDALGADVSVVAVEFSAGERYWQRPVEGAVVFVTEHEAPSREVTVTVYDSGGSTLASETLSLAFPRTEF